MLTTRSSLGLTLLGLIVASKCNIVATIKICESEDGQSSKRCRDDDKCCEPNGEVECCAASIPDAPWVLFFLIIGLLCGMTFCILYICCKYCKWRATSNTETNSEPRAGTNDIVERTTVEGSMVQRSLSTVQRVPIPLTLNNRNINVMKMEDVNKPSSNNSSNTTINDAPPPYPIDSEKPPPSYSEIDL